MLSDSLNQEIHLLFLGGWPKRAAEKEAYKEVSKGIHSEVRRIRMIDCFAKEHVVLIKRL